MCVYAPAHICLLIDNEMLLKQNIKLLKIVARIYYISLIILKILYSYRIIIIELYIKIDPKKVTIISDRQIQIFRY